LVPVANPNTENALLQLALILAKREQGTLLPIHVIAEVGQVIAPEALSQQHQLLEAAEQIGHAAVTHVESIGRVDDSVEKGIIRAAIEHRASLVVCGWKGFSTYRENFFGSIIDNLIRQSPIPILITRFPTPLMTTRRVILVASDLETTPAEFKRSIALAQILASELEKAAPGCPNRGKTEQIPTFFVERY